MLRPRRSPAPVGRVRSYRGFAERLWRIRASGFPADRSGAVSRQLVEDLISSI